MTGTRKIELITASDCPNAAAARTLLGQVLADLGRLETWIEWDRNAPASPPYAKRYGSPTILVDGADIAGDPSSVAGNSCRIYPGEGGRYSGLPARETLIAAIRRSPP